MDSNKLDVLKKTHLVNDDDFNFLKDHAKEFEHRYKTRGLFRSKTEMEASVLNDATHPTADSKYWQSIGEQNVQITELINMVYEAKKKYADQELLEAEIDDLQEQLETLDGHQARKVSAKLKRKKAEYEHDNFHLIEYQKTANERMREIKHWENIINDLIPQLEYGDDDFELHHAKRYYLRYKNRVDNQHLAKSDDNLQDYNLLKGFENAMKPRLEGTASKEFASLKEAGEQDPIANKFFNYKAKKILVGAPHRKADDRNITNFNKVQIPAGFTADIEQPIGYKVADAQNIIVERAINEGFDYIFFVEDDNIIPCNALVSLMSHKADVVGGLYYRKYLPLETAGMHYDDDGAPASIEYEIGDIIHDTLVLPSGCTLIKTDVFKDMEKPYYAEIFVDGRAQVTSDTYICEKFRQKGIDVITDTGVQCLHVDKSNGRVYGHEKFVDLQTLQIRPEHGSYFAI